MDLYAHSSVSDTCGAEVRRGWFWSPLSAAFHWGAWRVDKQHHKDVDCPGSVRSFAGTFLFKVNPKYTKELIYSRTRTPLCVTLLAEMWGRDIEDGTEKKKEKNENEDAPFYAQLRMGCECSSSVCAPYLFKSKNFWNTSAREGETPKCFNFSTTLKCLKKN